MILFLERRYPAQKFRHHSVEDDYYSPGYGGYPPYYNGYDYDSYHYRSQPSLYRDGNKYQHPNARYSHVSNSKTYTICNRQSMAV